MYANMSNMNNYLKALDYQMQWQEKQKKGDFAPAGIPLPEQAEQPSAPQGPETPAPQQREPTKEETALRQMQEILEKHKVEYAMNNIDTKLRTGKRLSPGELKYLQEKHPEKYGQAMRVQRDREEFERRLKNCRTKEEVRRLRMYAVQMGVSDFKAAEKAGDLERCVEVHARVMSLGDEHDKFTGSYQYAKLPENEHERAKLRKKGRSGVRVVRLVNYAALNTTYLDLVKTEQAGKQLPMAYRAASVAWPQSQQAAPESGGDPPGNPGGTPAQSEGTPPAQSGEKFLLYA